ncbi:hypothetical protein B9Z19DRAFT_1196699 [Tuber borchii]|uniref:Uncharacterized protein n=1 Tax=Tuber borchii TaxID=42251 RepID=A0A2T6ZE40_TUBBO|nr:hypothetical protein B9Z19DRAFT_1196699 [Tuber borchii]
MASTFKPIVREFAAPIAIVFCGSAIFGLNVLNRFDHTKNTVKLDNTYEQLQKATTELSVRLDTTNKEIQSIRHGLKNMNTQIRIIRDDIRLAQLIAGSAILVKVDGLKESTPEGEK